MREDIIAEYIWLDGKGRLRSKTKIVHSQSLNSEDFPIWSFDGSSTYQASCKSSDCLLKPVYVVKDPIAQNTDYLVLCEVLSADGRPHETNTRQLLTKVLQQVDQEPWFGFEQEYVLFERNAPLGWPINGFPAPQGPYYCGIGAEHIFGRELVLEHMHCCLNAGLLYYGLNAEVMPGQWEFQIGYRGKSNESADALTITDQMWIARWLLYRLAEKYNVSISLANKPVKGDWNGSGMHTNFSTKNMRDPIKGAEAIAVAIEKLKQKHAEHILVYGEGLSDRLTGIHETSSIDRFTTGHCDRSTSVRIPASVSAQGYGYLEDRRPGANADPYLVASRILSTICDVKNDDF